VSPSYSSRTQLVVVSAAGFVVWAGFGAVLPYLPLFLQEQAHASVALIGVVAGAYYVGSFLFSSPMGMLSDRVGRKPLLVSGVALYSISTLLFVTTTKPEWFVLFRLLEGAGAGILTPAALAFVADITPEPERGRAYGWLTSAQFGGLVAGPGLGILFYNLGGGAGLWAFYSIFVFGAAASALTALALVLLVREPRREARAWATSSPSSLSPPYSPDSHGAPHPRRPSYRTLLSPPVVAFLVVAATGNLAMGAWEVLWSIWLRHIGASMAFVGLTWTAFSVPMLLSFLGGRLADRHNRFVLMFSGLGFAALTWIAYGVLRDLQVFLVFCVLEGLAMAVAFPAKQAFLVQVSPPQWVGSVQGLEASTMQLAGLAGTLIAPLLYERVSGLAISLSGGAALVGLAVAAPTLYRASKKSTYSSGSWRPPQEQDRPPEERGLRREPALRTSGRA